MLQSVTLHLSVDKVKKKFQHWTWFILWLFIFIFWQFRTNFLLFLMYRQHLFLKIKSFICRKFTFVTLLFKDHFSCLPLLLICLVRTSLRFRLNMLYGGWIFIYCVRCEQTRSFFHRLGTSFFLRAVFRSKCVFSMFSTHNYRSSIEVHVQKFKLG